MGGARDADERAAREGCVAFNFARKFESVVHGHGGGPRSGSSHAIHDTNEAGWCGRRAYLIGNVHWREILRRRRRVQHSEVGGHGDRAGFAQQKTNLTSTLSCV